MSIPKKIVTSKFEHTICLAVERGIIPFKLWDAAYKFKLQMNEFEAENAVIAIAIGSISNAEIIYFKKNLCGNSEFKWY